MRNLTFLVIVSIFLFSCGRHEEQTKKWIEKEPERKKQERDLEEKTISNQDSVSAVQEVTYQSHNPCTFRVSLPSHFKLRTMYDERNLDYCDYNVTSENNPEFIEIHSLNNVRFEYNEIDELYSAALRESKLEISYKIQKGNWFVISGTNPTNGNIVYWKRVRGERFISDLHIEYPKSRASAIVPYISTISTSFTSD